MTQNVLFDKNLWFTAAENSTNAMFITDINGVIVWINNAFTTLLGYDLNEVKGKKPNLWKYDDGSETKRRIWNLLWRTILSGKTWSGEVTNVKKNGELYTCLQTITPIFDKSNQTIQYFIASHSDITESKKTYHDLLVRNNQINIVQNIAKIGYWEWDEKTKLFHWSDHAYCVFGLNKDDMDLTIDGFLKLIYEEDKQKFITELSKSINDKTNFICDIRIIRYVDHEIRILHFDSIVTITENGHDICGVFQDITEQVTSRKIAEKHLIDQLNFVNSMISSNPNAIYYKDRMGNLQGCNKAFRLLFNIKDTDDIIGKKLDHTPLFDEYFQQITSLEERSFNDNRSYHVEIQINDFNDTSKRDLIFYVSPYVNDQQEVNGVIGTIIDITDRKQIEDKIRHMAYHDALTGTANRSYFLQHLEQQINTTFSRRKDGLEKNTVIFLLDLDHFKDVNDTLGHQIGDILLKEATTRIESCLRKQDLLARVGGDEFAIVLDCLNPEIVAQKIIDAVKEPYHIADNLIHVNVSIGIATYPKDGLTSQELLKSADMAMYKAKGDGRGKFHFFTEEMNSEVKNKKQIEDDLRIAIIENQFEMYYQPRINIKQNRVSSAECLIRWNHPAKGLVFPGAFIDIIEKNGMIITISEWILDNSCKILKKWIDDGLDVGMSLNISPNHFKTINFIPYLKSVIDKYQIDTSYLELEITENILLEKTDRIIKNMNFLHDMGIHMSIDDFGTGYSSLNYLRKIKVKGLKIDKSFIDLITKDNDSDILVNTMIGLGKNFNISTVAEGVETKEQADFLIQNECTEIQGYYFSKPVKLESFEEFVKNFNCN